MDRKSDCRILAVQPAFCLVKNAQSLELRVCPRWFCQSLVHEIQKKRRALIDESVAQSARGIGLGGPHVFR
ncbi:protein of unknown function [Pararobbsia alpina]